MLLFHTAIDLAYWTFLIKLIFWLPLWLSWLKKKKAAFLVLKVGKRPSSGLE